MRGESIDKWSAFLDYSVMADHSETIQETMALDTEQMRVFSNGTRIDGRTIKGVANLEPGAPLRFGSVDAVLEELEGWVGELPEPTVNLGGLVQARLYCRELGIARCAWLKVRVQFADDDETAVANDFNVEDRRVGAFERVDRVHDLRAVNGGNAAFCIADPDRIGMADVESRE